MFLFQTSEADLQEALKELKSRPYSPPPAPSLLTGSGRELLNVPMRIFDKLMAPSVPDDASSHRNDPATQGLAAQFIEGSTDLAPFLAGAASIGKVISWFPTPISKGSGLALQALPGIAGAIYGLVSKRKETSKLYQYQGIDKETADNLGWQEGIAQVASMSIPVALPLKSIAGRVASGAALNIPAGGIVRGLASSTLKEAGYHEMAKHYKILDVEAIILDGLMGSFGAFLHTKQAKDLIKGKATDATQATFRVIGDLTDAIHDRVLHRHATRESSIGLHTTYEAHKAHMETFESTINSVAKGERPVFDDANLKTIEENVISDPHFKSHLPETEPHPVKSPMESEPHAPLTSVEPAGETPFSHIDEHASYRFAELEKKSPELAKDVHETLGGELKMANTVKDKKLYQVAIDCFLRTGGIK